MRYESGSRQEETFIRISGEEKYKTMARERKGFIILHCPIWLFGCFVLRTEPAAYESSATQPVSYVWATSHQPPQESCPIVFNHGYDWALIESVVAKRHPAVLISVSICERRVVAAFEPILTRHLGKMLVEVIQ